MLHPDSERRIGDVINLAELLEQKRYHKTANEIRSFVEILKGKKVPEDLLKKMDSLFNLFQKEFEASLPVGQNFRKRCFEEIKSIVFGAIGRMGIIDFNQAILSTYPFLKRINFATKITGAIAEELNGKRITDKNVIFHLRCYAYLLLVEGIFDELARILYFLIKVSKNNVPSSGNLEKMTVWDILKRLGTTPVFLEKWEEKKTYSKFHRTCKS